MKRFYFDLVAQPRGVGWLRASVFVLGAVAMSGLVYYGQAMLYPELMMQRQQLKAEMAKLGTTVAPVGMNSKDLAQSWQQARSVSVQLGLPWQSFFVQLGIAAKGGDVAFISIEPDAQKGHVVLIAEARSLEAMLHFISQLQTSTDFSEVELQSHTVDKTMPEKPVRFRVSATWRSTE